MSVDICKFQLFCFRFSLLFCFRFSSHLIKKRPYCYMAFHKCFVSSIVEMIGSIREIIPIQIGLSLSDEISYQEQMYLPSFFLLLLLASFSDSLFLFFAGADQLSNKKALKEAITCARERAAHGIARKEATAAPPLAQGSMKFTTFKNMMLHLFASLRLRSS